MLEAISASNSRDLYAEVKKLNPKPSQARRIDNIDRDDGIAELFREKYERLYNSVHSDVEEMQRIEQQIGLEASRCPLSCAAVSAGDVVVAVKKLKQMKHDGDHGFMSNHLIHGGQCFFQEISLMMTAMFVHGVQPDDLLKASIVSIPKSLSKSLSDSSNYRGIALCSSLSKIVDLVILQRNRMSLWTSDLQFAFKEGMSTSMCTLILKEVVTYYRTMKSNVYSCFLDATKAFDRIRFDRLFAELIERRVSMPDLRLLLHLYLNQRVRTTWRESASNYFSVSNGIRQGSIASPVLFCVYLNVLLSALKESGEGCWMGRQFCGVMAYADDLTLLAPSLSALKAMLRRCEQFCHDADVQFNASKSVAVCFGATCARNLGLPSLSFCGGRIAWADNVKHLGNYVAYNLSEKKEIEMKKADLIGRVNFVLGRYGAFPLPVLLRIFNSQCSHFYGSQAWLLSDPAVSKFHTMYNRCLRRVCRMPAMTHTRYLPFFSNAPSSLMQIANRTLTLARSVTSIDNETVNSIARFISSRSDSILRRNQAQCAAISDEPLSDIDQSIVTAISELVASDTIFDEEEALEFAHFLCVT